MATQFLLVGAGGLQLSPIEGVMYLSPACVLWLVLGSVLLEVPQMRAAGLLGVPFQYGWLFLGASLLGFFINILAYTTIQLASSLTLKVRGVGWQRVTLGLLLPTWAGQWPPDTAWSGTSRAVNTVIFPRLAGLGNG